MNLKEARYAIRYHLKECCQNVLEWHKTGIVPLGKFVEISNEFCDGDHRLAEAEVNRLAMEHCVQWI